MTSPQTRVLVIGAGRRVKEGILPALICLQDRFSIEGIVSRTPHKVSLFHDQFNMETITELNTINFSTLEMITLSASLTEVPKILKQLSTHDTRHITLFIDTPVFHHTHLGNTKWLKGFKRILVPEDGIALPSFLLAKKLIHEGKIGRLKHVYFFHSGYRYHALASLKMLSDCKYISAIRSDRFHPELFQTHLRFPNGVTATIVDPRDYSVGRFMIIGTKGCIVDYELNGDFVQRIGYRMEGDNYRGLMLNGEPVAPDELDTLYQKHISDDLFKKSPMNSLKIRGLMSLFSNFEDPHSPYAYTPDEGLYDLLSIMVSEKFGRFKDVGLSPEKKSFFYKIIHLASKLMPSV